MPWGGAASAGTGGAGGSPTTRGRGGAAQDWELGRVRARVCRARLCALLDGADRSGHGIAVGVKASGRLPAWP